MAGDSKETNRLVELAAQGEQGALDALLARHRPQLRRMVALRLDPRLRTRVDPSDVIQDVYLEASARWHDYLHARTMPLFLWLRLLTGQKIVTLHRHHLGVRMRTATQEVPLGRAGFPEASSVALADHFLDKQARPSEAAIRSEQRQQVQAALEQMAPLDREVLALRHFEQLSRAEIAAVLEVSEAAAGKRYIRALERLKIVLGGSSDASEEGSSRD